MGSRSCLEASSLPTILERFKPWYEQRTGVEISQGNARKDLQEINKYFDEKLGSMKKGLVKLGRYNWFHCYNH